MMEYDAILVQQFNLIGAVRLGLDKLVPYLDKATWSNYHLLAVGM